MTPESNVLIERIYEQARQLPPESLTDLAKFMEFLTFKASSDTTEDRLVDVSQIMKLEGILVGYDVSPEALAETRRELWAGFGELDS